MIGEGSANFDPVPMELESLLDPAWLAWALDDVGDDDRIVGVEQVDASQTIAQKVRFRVTVAGADGAERTNSYCVKAHFGDPGPGSLRTEAHVYRDLLPKIETRSPRAYYTGIDDVTGRSLIVMDDIVAERGHFMSAREPYSLETARDTLGQLARCHAATWGDEQWASVDWLAPRVAVMAQNYPTEVLQGLMDDGRGPDIAPELRNAENLVAAMLVSAETPFTSVIHGDTHSGNVYLDADGRACWLDWQCTQRGHWSTDVSYHLGTTLDIEDRRNHEADLLRHYLGELEVAGVEPPSWDEAWERYALGFTYGYFLWVITRISSRAVVLIHIPRLATALSDHDTFRRLGVT
ncbi:MAG: phosphotransferase [Acidimicrobiia bacterium]